MNQTLKDTIFLLAFVAFVIAVATGCYLIEQDMRCEDFKNTRVRDLPVRCLEYYAK